jgi:nicotinate-nucleotide pyrophosphorylase (carboxylating)
MEEERLIRKHHVPPIKEQDYFCGIETGPTNLHALDNIKFILSIAETGVDFISIGALTKHCQAVDLSMRII